MYFNCSLSLQICRPLNCVALGDCLVRLVEGPALIEWVSILIPFESREPIKLIHLNLSSILRVFNCGQAIDTDKLDNICKYTYEFIVVEFPWVNVTPSLHKLLEHCVELIQSCNDGYGMKQYSEEALEACNS